MIAAPGPWNEPLIPDVPGLADFDGEVFRSSRWNHQCDLTGKRVAVVASDLPKRPRRLGRTGHVAPGPVVR